MSWSTGVVPLDVSQVDVGRLTFFVSASGAVPHISAQLGCRQPGSTARKWAARIAERISEMYLTNVTAYRVCMHDKCHYVLYGRTVTVPSLHFG